MMLVPRTSVLSDSSMLRSGWAIDGAVREVSSGNIRRAGAARAGKSEERSARCRSLGMQS